MTDIERVDGRAKVTGAAWYTGDLASAETLHAVAVGAGITRGRVVSIDTSDTEAMPGVRLVLTHRTMPRLRPPRYFMAGGHASGSTPIMQSDRISYRGELIAAVVADTAQQAHDAAERLCFGYERERPATTLDHPAAGQIAGDDVPQWFRPPEVGDAHKAFQHATHRVDRMYETAAQFANPLELSATLVIPGGDGTLEVVEGSQGVRTVATGLAEQLNLPMGAVRVRSPAVGGSFGLRGATAPLTVIAAVAARRLGRPVRLALTRRQMFETMPFRPASRHRVRLATDNAGRLTTIVHDVHQQTSRTDLFPATGANEVARLYAVRHFHGDTRYDQLDTQAPGFMRAPSEMAAFFALESAVDELAEDLRQDPVEFRLNNLAAADPIAGKPFSSNHAARCLRIGAERFGWRSRTATSRPPHGTDGSLIGWGCALGAYQANSAATQAAVTLLPTGRVEVRVGGHEMGQGIGTAATAVAAGVLGCPAVQVEVRLGDTDIPGQHTTAGSWGTAMTAPPVAWAARALRDRLTALAGRQGHSPGTQARIVGNRLVSPDLIESIGLDSLLPPEGLTERVASPAPNQDQDAVTGVDAGRMAWAGPVYEDFVAFSYGAQFVEVHIHPRLNTIRVTRALGVFDCGRVLSARTARSQALGGLVWGIGSALHEGAEIDHGLGGVHNTDLASYLVPVNADIPDLDVSFIDEPDPVLNDLGVKGVAEITMVGTAAAIANAVRHATGRRIRRLPIRLGNLR